MGKIQKILLSVILGLFGLVYAAFLLLPVFIDLDDYKPHLVKTVENETGLKLDYKSAKVKTRFDLTAGAVIEELSVKAPDSKNLLSAKQLSARVALFPLIFNKIEVADVSIDTPEINLIRLKNGKFNVESFIPSSDTEQKSVENSEELAEQPKANTAELSKFNARISNYTINLTDFSLSKPENFMLKGDLLEVNDLNPEKFVKLAAKGQLLVNSQPQINFDVKLASELPLVEEAKTEQAAATTTSAKPQKVQVNPLENFLKYDFKTDVVADLKLKRGECLPEIDGSLEFNNLSLKVDGQKLPDSSGKFEFSGKKIDLASKLFITPEAFFEVAGEVKNIAKNDYDINVKTSDIALTDVKKFAYSLADAFGVDTAELKKVNLSGNLKADFNVKKKDCQGFLRVTGAKVSYDGISRPLDKINVNLKFANDRIVFEETAAYLGDIKLDVAGYLTSALDADVIVSAPGVNFATILNVANNSKLLADLKPQLKDISSVSGGLSVVAFIKGNLNDEIQPVISINNIDLAFKHSAAPMTVWIEGGEVAVNANNVKISNVQVNAFDEPIKVSGSIADYAGACNINVIASGNVSAADARKYLPKEVWVKKTVPMIVKITGIPESLDVNAQANITDLASVVEFDQPAGSQNILNINMNVKPTVLALKDTGVFSGLKVSKDLSGFYKLGSVPQIISLAGNINNYNAKDPDLNNIKVNFSGLNLRVNEPKGKLQLNGDLVVKGKASAPSALGVLNVKNIDVPSLHLKADSVNVDMKETEIVFTTGILGLDDSRLAMTAVLENKLSPPFVVKSMNINSEFLNIDKLAVAFQPQAQPTARQVANQPVQRPPVSAAAPDIPLIITSGKFTAKQLVVSNLLNKDLAFDFVINPLNRLNIRNFITHVGGGTATGIIDMNLKTTKLNLDCTADNVEINALASTLAQTPNEIFGAMKGRIKLTTMGSTPEAMTQNAVGRVDFNIVDGHLPKLGSLNYLFKSKNHLASGLTDALLNNTLSFDEAEKTNHFEQLNGLVMINRGMLEIQDISMQGKYLSSFISGTLRMQDNYADLTMLNKLSGRVVKNLGPITDISVDKLLRKNLGEWGALLADQRLANEYPHRDRIPALTAEPRENDRDFAVKIRGNLNQPHAVRMFEWLP